MFQCNMPDLNSTENSLQLYENITLFVVCCIYTDFISKETLIRPGVWAYDLYIGYNVGAGWNLVAPLLVYLMV
jgi:hypothetical protein